MVEVAGDDGAVTGGRQRRARLQRDADDGSEVVFGPGLLREKVGWKRGRREEREGRLRPALVFLPLYFFFFFHRN